MKVRTSKQDLLPVIVWVAVVIFAAFFALGGKPRHSIHGAARASDVAVDPTSRAAAIQVPFCS